MTPLDPISWHVGKYSRTIADALERRSIRAAFTMPVDDAKYEKFETEFSCMTAQEWADTLRSIGCL